MSGVASSALPAGPRPERIELRAADGTRLVGCRFPAVGAPRASLRAAGATGLPQGFFHRRFAQHAAAT